MWNVKTRKRGSGKEKRKNRQANVARNYERHGLVRFRKKMIKCLMPSKVRHGEKNDCNRYKYNVTHVTEKYSNIRPSEVNYIKKKKIKCKIV